LYQIEQLAANAMLWWLHCLVKQKVSFVFHSTKISKRCPWKTEFFADVISQKWCTNQQKQLWNNAFYVKTSQSAQNYSSLILKKWKSAQRAVYTLLHETLELYIQDPAASYRIPWKSFFEDLCEDLIKDLYQTNVT